MIGYLARSLSGHDKGRVYVIIEANEAYALLADGTLRTKENPKKKNIKHIQIIKITISTDSNETIKHSIREYNRRTVDV